MTKLDEPVRHSLDEAGRPAHVAARIEFGRKANVPEQVDIDTA